MLGGGGLLVGAAEVWMNHVFEPLQHTSGLLVEQVFPRTARLDLLLLVGLAILVAAVVVYDRREAVGPATSSLILPLVLAVGLGVAGGVLLSPTAGLLVPFAFLAVGWVGPCLTDQRGAEIQRLLALALAPRIAVAFGLGLYGLATHGGLPVLDDEESLHRAAVEVAPILTGGFGYVQPAWWHLPNSYLSLLASLYALIGPDFTAVRLLNASLGALGVALVYGTLERLFDRRAARAGALVVAVWPAVVLWTGTGLRESLFTTCTLLVPWLLTRRLSLPAWSVAAAAAALALLVVAALRNYATAGLALALGAAAIRRQALLAPLLVVGGLLVWQRLPLAQEITPRGVETRAAAIELSTIPETDPAKRAQPPDPQHQFFVTQIVRAMLPGDAGLTTAVVYGYQTQPFAYVVATDPNTFYVLPPERVQAMTDDNVTWGVPLARLLSGLRLLFVPPAPWAEVSVQRLVTIPDALGWDILFALGLMAVAQRRRAWSAASLVTLVYLVLMILALALASAYLGTAVRHRAMLVPWLAMLAAPGLARLALRVEFPRLLRDPSRVRLLRPGKLEADGVGRAPSARPSLLLDPDGAREDQF